ncbi:ParB N-terminal domain-containing protein [Clostridium botulinum]
MIENKNYNYDKLIRELTGCLGLKQFLMKKPFVIKTLENKVDEEIINNLFNQNIQVEMLSERELYLITETFYKMLLKDDFISKLNELQQQLKMDLNPELYFTEDEIRQYKNSLLPVEEEQDFKTVVFKDVKFMKEGIYSGVADFNYILDLREKGILFYNINCQRETEKYEWRGTWIEKAKVFSKSIREISKSMAEDEYIPTYIAINVPSNGQEDFHIIDKENGLYDIIIRINKNTNLNLIDGNHRTTGGSLARNICRRKGKDFVLNMGVQIMNLDPYLARQYIFQESKKNPLDETLTKAMEMTIENKIAYYMNKGGGINGSPLAGKLGRELKDVKRLNKLTPLYIFADGLKYFELDEFDIIREDKVKKFLKEFFKYVLSFHKEKMKNIKLSREEGYELNMHMFRGYLYIASKLMNDADWKERLIDVLEKIDYRKNGILEDMHLYKDEMSKTNIKRLEEYIDSLLESGEKENGREN